MRTTNRSRKLDFNGVSTQGGGLKRVFGGLGVLHALEEHEGEAPRGVSRDAIERTVISKQIH